MKYYRYTAFGMQIDSEIVLPGLPQGGKKPADVKILCGDVPEKINVPLKETCYYQAAVNEFLLQVKGIADYYIANGKQIVMRLDNEAHLCDVRTYLLGTAMGVLLMQRGILPIHGSTVVINGCGVIFTGISGAGKSTIAAALHKKGFSLLADDVSAVTFDQRGVPWVQPGYPQQKLWQASASIMGIDTTTLDKVCSDRDKYIVPVSKGFRRLPIPITAVYEIDVQACTDVSIIPLRGVEKLVTIMGNTYRAEMINGLGLHAAHFQKCAALLNHVQVFRLTRPPNVMSVDRQVALVIHHFMELQATSPEWTARRCRKAGG